MLVPQQALGSARFPRTQSSKSGLSIEKTGRGVRPAGGGASLQRSDHRDGGAKAPLEFAGQGKGLLSGDQAQLFDGLTAAAHGGGDALMAIGLDANCFAEAQGLRDRCGAPGCGAHSRERLRVPWKGKAWNTPTEAHWGGDGKDRVAPKGALCRHRGLA